MIPDVTTAIASMIKHDYDPKDPIASSLCVARDIQEFLLEIIIMAFGLRAPAKEDEEDYEIPMFKGTLKKLEEL